jgi:23S rRNA (uridine2552-2'-O)-methyltransferase
MKKIQDHFFNQAKKEGYRARSVYKLAEIAEKYKLIKKQQNILDLGAAPGSWSQYILKKLGVNGKLTAIDLKPIESLPNAAPVEFLQMDFLADEAQQILEQAAPYDGIVSDMAPETSGKPDVDHVRSVELAEEVFSISLRMLKSSGFVICKVFMGEDFQELLKTVKTNFKFVKSAKPKASRVESREVFIVAIERNIN